MKNQDKPTKKTKLSGLKNFFLVLEALPKHNEYINKHAPGDCRVILSFHLYSSPGPIGGGVS